LRGKIQRVGILAGFFVLALVNCGGGGGGGDNGGGGGVIADFAANCLNTDPCATGAVTMQKGTAAGNMVEVVIWLNKLNTTIGEASLDLGFDPTVADYQGYTEGTALGGSGGGTVYQVSELGPGEVLADIAPPAGGKSVSSPAIMIKLTFKLLKTTPSSVLSFRNPNTVNGSALYNTSAAVILTVSGWTGGVFIGT
jgi:Cohesin domain